MEKIVKGLQKCFACRFLLITYGAQKHAYNKHHYNID